jgi:hypothetical protein
VQFVLCLEGMTTVEKEVCTVGARIV